MRQEPVTLIVLSCRSRRRHSLCIGRRLIDLCCCRFASKQQEVRELQDRLFDYALPAPDDGNDDALTDAAPASTQDRGARGRVGVDAKQEAVIAEVQVL